MANRQNGDPAHVQTPVASDTTLKAIADLATEAELRHVHLLAWRDLDDDEAGGSEVHADQIASIWTQAGLGVTMRTSHAVGRPSNAVRNGYSVSRKGSRYSVFPRTVLAEVAGRLGPCDGLVEIWNGVPFMSPLWWHRPGVVWLHHIHGPMWGQSLPGPIARGGVLLEEKLAPPVYRRRSIVTLSDSSKRELVDELGFDETRVSVITPGVDPFFTPGGTRSPTPLVTAVGRLVPVKDFPRLVDILARVRSRVADVELVIVGEGYERDRILEAIRRHDATSWVRLPGRVSDVELRDLYRSSWAVSSASTREGWGMTLTEAAACGTPAVASDISGHADAITVGRSGLLGHTDDEIADALTDVLTDAGLRARLQSGALARAAELTWEAAAVANFEVLAADARDRRIRSGRPAVTAEGIVLGVDLDGVCADYTSAFRSLVAEDRGVDPESLTTDVSWDFGEWGLDRDEFLRLHRIAVQERRMFRDMPVIDGASETLWRLSDAGVWIRIITHRLVTNWGHALIVSDTVEWLDSQRIPYRDLCFLGNKPEAQADVYVEDAPHNIDALRASGNLVIAFDQPYNRSMAGPRAEAWHDVESIVADLIVSRTGVYEEPLPGMDAGATRLDRRKNS